MSKMIIPIFVVVLFVIAFILSVVYGKERDTTLYFGNITGSGLPEDYVRAHADDFPLSGFPESEEAREKFLSSFRRGKPEAEIPPGAWGGGGGGSKSTVYIMREYKK